MSEVKQNMLVVGRMGGLTRCVMAECSQAARDLASSHLAGPTASAALAEGLVAVSLLSADLGTTGEAVTLYIQCDGPLGSMLVEATYEGTLRGYTAKKILNDLDGRAEASRSDAARQDALSTAFGATGTATVMASLPGKALAAYYAEGSQREVKVGIAVTLDAEGRVATARGVLLERMPGSDPAEFAALEPLATAEGRKVEGLEDATIRPLRFACRCSREKALATLRALPAEERRELAARTAPIDIYCHMCGKCHSFSPGEVGALDTTTDKGKANDAP